MAESLHAEYSRFFHQTVRLLPTLAIVALLACCAGNVTGTRADVLAEQAEQPTASTKEYNRGKCEVGNPDGKRCDKRVCKKDSTGDCRDFAQNCLENGHHHNGTSDAGTCSRIY